MKAWSAFFCLVFLGAGLSYAQTPEAPVGVMVTAIFDGSDHEPLERQIVDVFRQQLRARDIPSEGRHRMTLLIDALADEPGERVVLSVTKLMALPEEVIEQGATEEAFYKRFAQTALPEEGRPVRQYMSREWLSQFHEVVDQEMRVVALNRLEEAVAALVAELPQP